MEFFHFPVACVLVEPLVQVGKSHIIVDFFFNIKKYKKAYNNHLVRPTLIKTNLPSGYLDEKLIKNIEGEG